MKVGQVQARDMDGDSSLYGKITYSFVNQSSKNTIHAVRIYCAMINVMLITIFLTRLLSRLPMAIE